MQEYEIFPCSAGSASSVAMNSTISRCQASCGVLCRRYLMRKRLMPASRLALESRPVPTGVRNDTRTCFDHSLLPIRQEQTKMQVRTKVIPWPGGLFDPEHAKDERRCRTPHQDESTAVRSPPFRR